MSTTLKEEMLGYASQLCRLGLYGALGVIAARAEDGHILISRENAAFDALTQDDFISLASDDQAAPEPQKSLCALLASHPALAGAILLDSPFAKAFSQGGGTLRASLDDTAQIAGGRIRTANSMASADIARGLGKNFGCFVKNTGMLTAGRSLHEAYVAALVLEKGARAEVQGKAFGGAKPLSFFDCALMRSVYLKKYSQIQEKSV